MGSYCKAFNAQTQGVEAGSAAAVVITAYADKSFTFIIKTPADLGADPQGGKGREGQRQTNTDKVAG